MEHYYIVYSMMCNGDLEMRAINEEEAIHSGEDPVSFFPAGSTGLKQVGKLIVSGDDAATEHLPEYFYM